MEIIKGKSWEEVILGVSMDFQPTLQSKSSKSWLLLDSGIWPESESFREQSFGPIPSKWKGVCYGGIDFMCNRKSFYFLLVYIGNGHNGTHTAAGNIVMDVSYYGIVEGTIRGGAPAARNAVYNACAFPCCDDADILA
ncbi:unnamed protein product [Coffea canephora]|uniref:Peptidase S8/S53 domain-containing protein n=1 Tax=Coffea canephora TaxID=49390 RepID=A0A068V8L6_COFCA|nr:unnamed protein product [Coffea canephora]